MTTCIATKRAELRQAVVTDAATSRLLAGQGVSVVVVADDVEEALAAAASAIEPELMTVVYRADRAVTLETLDERLLTAGVNLVAELYSMGRPARVMKRIRRLGEAGATLMLSAENPDAAEEAVIASSLGLHSGILLERNSELDDSLADTVSYQFYGRMAHAPIEPWATMGARYCDDMTATPGCGVLDDPMLTLHLTAGLDWALTAEDAAAGRYFDHGIADLAATGEKARRLARAQWQELMVDCDACTFCPAFRVCQGWFAGQREKGKCRELLDEVREAVQNSEAGCGQLNREEEPCRR